ncbi:MAG: hypothetical protein FWF24_05965 [Alphaproteobacteria bacterium]|nr:hypothetical protein [Alphaproteobacteria bacterium]
MNEQDPYSLTKLYSTVENNFSLLPEEERSIAIQSFFDFTKNFSDKEIRDVLEDKDLTLNFTIEAYKETATARQSQLDHIEDGVKQTNRDSQDTQTLLHTVIDNTNPKKAFYLAAGFCAASALLSTYSAIKLKDISAAIDTSIRNNVSDSCLKTIQIIYVLPDGTPYTTPEALQKLIPKPVEPIKPKNPTASIAKPSHRPQ